MLELPWSSWRCSRPTRRRPGRWRTSTTSRTPARAGPPAPPPPLETDEADAGASRAGRRRLDDDAGGHRRGGGTAGAAVPLAGGPAGAAGLPDVEPPPEEPQAATIAITEPSEAGRKGVIRIAQGYPREGRRAASAPARSSGRSWTKRAARPRRIGSRWTPPRPGRGALLSVRRSSPAACRRSRRGRAGAALRGAFSSPSCTSTRSLSLPGHHPAGELLRPPRRRAAGSRGR